MGKRALVSPVWDYFEELPGPAKRAKCMRCNKEMTASGTSGMRYHLQGHGISVGNAVTGSRPIPEPKEMMKENIAEAAALNNLNFAQLANDKIYKEYFAKCFGLSMPSSANTVKKYLLEVHAEKIIAFKQDIQQAVKKGQRFSLTFDECSAAMGRQYVNVNIHTEDAYFSLGLILITEGTTAGDIKKMVEEKVESFGLKMKRHIVGGTTDGARNMAKVGEISDWIHQKCLSHGLHLVVSKKFYGKEISQEDMEDEEETTEEQEEEEEEEETDTELSEDELIEVIQKEIDEKDALAEEAEVQEIDADFKTVLKKLRKVVKLFKYSPKRNRILQKEVVAKFGREYVVILDLRTRWNSTFAMVERAVKLEVPIRQTLTQLNFHDYDLDMKDFKTLKTLLNLLQPFAVALQGCGRVDNNIAEGEESIDFIRDQLIESSIGQTAELIEALEEEYLKRRNPEAVALLRYLSDPEAYKKYRFPYPLLRSVEQFGCELYTRLFGDESEDEEESVDESSETEGDEESGEEPKTIKELYYERMNALKTQSDAPSKSTIQKHFQAYRTTKQLTEELRLLKNALLTLKSTSNQAEREFSITKRILDGNRQRLGPEVLDALIFMKCHYIRKAAGEWFLKNP